MKQTYNTPCIEVVELDAEEMLTQIRASYNIYEAEKQTNFLTKHYTSSEHFISFGDGMDLTDDSNEAKDMGFDWE